MERSIPMRRPLLAALLALLAGCGRQGATGAGDLAARYIDAAGGREILTSLQTIHTLDSLFMAGLAGTSEAWWQRTPFRGRVIVQVGPVGQEMILLGDSVWSVDRNGALTPGDEMTRSQALLAASTVFYDAFLDTSRLSAGTDTVLEDGEAVSRLILTSDGLEPVTYFLSAATGLPVMMHASMMGIDVYSRPGDWRDVSGIISPGSTTDRIPALGQESTSRNILTEYNVQIPAQVFAVLGGAADWSLPSPGVAFPFVLDGEHIYMQGSVGNRTIEILLDSGAGATVIDSALAAGMGLEPAGSFNALGVGGSSSFSFVVVPEYSAAGAFLRNQSLAAMPLDAPFYPLTGHHIGLVVGYDFLSRFVTLIDYGSRTITLYDPASFEYNGQGSSIPASRTMGLLSIEAVIEDSIPATLLLDTGAGGALHLSASFLLAHPQFLSGRHTSESMVQGVGGGQATSVFRAGDLALGNFIVPAGLSSTGADIPVLSAFDGIIGNGVLARFRVFLDYSGERVILEPSSLFYDGLAENMTGLGVEIDQGRLRVAEVLPGSAADWAGLLEDDMIATVRGIAPGDRPGLLDSLLSGQEGTEVEMEVDRPDGRHALRLVLRRTL
jgi:hypothetical protein